MVRARFDPVKDDDGENVGEIITGPSFGAGRTPFLASLPPYCSSGQKSHKAFATHSAAREWLIRKHVERQESTDER